MDSAARECPLGTFEWQTLNQGARRYDFRAIRTSSAAGAGGQAAASPARRSSRDAPSSTARQETIPENGEVWEYAGSIGILPRSEPELLWIASAGYKAPLPAGWAQHRDKASGRPFYFDSR